MLRYYGRKLSQLDLCRFFSFGFLFSVGVALTLFLLPQTVYSADITLAWDANGEDDLAGYRIYVRQEGQSYDYSNPAWEGTETTCTIYDLDDETTYCFVARAFDTSDNESGDSNEVCHTPNRPPVLNSIGVKTVQEGQLLEFTITASDPDGDPLTHSASNVPPGATFDPGTQTFSWTPDFVQAGSYPNVTFTVTDDGSPNLNDSEVITITVNDTNRAPVLDAVGNKAVDEGQLLQFTITSTDPDIGDTLTHSAKNLPTGASVDSVTGIFTWTPNYIHAGTYTNILFTVTDDGTPKLSDSKAITITVTDVNRAPVFSSIGNRTTDEGSGLVFAVIATDPDGDTLTLTDSNLPTGATFTYNGDGTGIFSWTPDYTRAGSYPNVTFTATDDGTPNLNDLEAITITVNDVNRAPVLDPVGDKTVDEAAPLLFTVTASDPDGDALTYSASNLPAGASFHAGTQTFTWTPGFGAARNYAVTFTVTDNGTPAQSHSEEVTIHVSGDTKAPSAPFNLRNG